MLEIRQASGSSPLETTVQLSSGKFSGDVSMSRLIIDLSAAIIIFEHSFYILDQRLNPQDQKEAVPSFYIALEQYLTSPHATAVAEAVSTAVAKAVGTTVHAKQMPAWKAKLLFGLLRRKAKRSIEPSRERDYSQQKDYSQKKAELIERVYKIVLEHRLPRPLMPGSA
ncbi:hypothetical protein DEU56DRAFT_401040 [Suillus clintonianus]|uniref:uncharacterized protein n=1 Tax=Suillus clintonianus TaxID=1904413 RepID=UPI001B880681|nr:uncharacterized protein DEU56DRAFT_401040 [Suillus clintonianus]KAG2135154.1 hypothetical protein DEU56DRAFT_401040 [Suillus clintonianus]